MIIFNILYHSLKKNLQYFLWGKKETKSIKYKELALTTGRAISLKEQHILLTFSLIFPSDLPTFETHLTENPSQQWNLS